MRAAAMRSPADILKVVAAVMPKDSPAPGAPAERRNLIPDTYETSVEAEADRAQQKALLAALIGWDRALRRDECGAWRITGSRGSIHTWGDGKSWVLFVGCRSATHWTYTKRRLAFCRVTQDGEDEGCLQLQQLPTAEQAEVIRDVLGIRKRVELGPEELERRRALGKRLALAAGMANEAGAVPMPLLEQVAILDAKSTQGSATDERLPDPPSWVSPQQGRRARA